MKRIVKVVVLAAVGVATIAAGVFAMLCWLLALDERDKQFKEYLESHNYYN